MTAAEIVAALIDLIAEYEPLIVVLVAVTVAMRAGEWALALLRSSSDVR